ncbi:MAG: nucleotidyltransferase [Defluviitaleaceae bacterium]|nr:nucleotidyltransferase [Defluviitaleaceae bacterium]
MNILGLIVEYNPLHNGHVHHIKESKKLVHPDVTIAVMSGHFTQRGEPTCTTKWNRTELALANGIDLIIELPYAYSNQSADLFATGAVSILNHLFATHLVFGSEHGDINTLITLADVMDHADIQEKVKKGLTQGLSLPTAYAQANPALTGANNTLGIQYIRAIQKMRAPITSFTIKRYASDYHDRQPTHPHLTSATAIRQMMNEDIDYSPYVPLPINDPHVTLQNWHQHYKFLRHKLLTKSPQELEKIHDMVEGIENRLASAAKIADHFLDFMRTVETKRYTQTRIQRICTNILTETTKADIASWQVQKGVPYIRPLGFNKKGSAYLKQIKEKIEIPIYSTFKKDAHPMLKHEQKVTAAYASVYEARYATEVMKKEYANKPIIKT